MLMSMDGFLSPSITTGDNYRPDLLFLMQSKSLYILELTVGFQSNLENSAVQKKENTWTWSKTYKCYIIIDVLNLQTFP